MIDIVVPHAARNVEKLLFAGIAEDNWHTKLLSLRLLGQFADRATIPFARTLNQVVPVVSAAMWDTRNEVKKGASEATLKALNTCQVLFGKQMLPTNNQGSVATRDFSPNAASTRVLQNHPETTPQTPENTPKTPLSKKISRPQDSRKQYKVTLTGCVGMRFGCLGCILQVSGYLVMLV